MSWSAWRKKCKGGEGRAARRIFEAARDKRVIPAKPENFFEWGIGAWLPANGNRVPKPVQALIHPIPDKKILFFE
jgi:hypothetical protein